MTANQVLPAVKRVMSKDQNVRDEKKSRINAEGGVEGDDGAAAAALKQLAIEDAATALDAHENDGAASPFPDVCRVPVATISQNQSRASTTHSSLSTEGGDFRTEDAASAGGDKNIDGSAVPAGAVVQEGTLKRQVSQDSVNNRQQGDAAALDRSVSSASEETGGSANRGSPSVGNWGWFEDVHAHEGGFLPNTGGGDGAPSAASRRDSGGTPQRKKKKGGLLHIGSEIMQNVLAAIVEPNRQQSELTFSHFFLAVVAVVLFYEAWGCVLAEVIDTTIMAFSLLSFCRYDILTGRTAILFWSIPILTIVVADENNRIFVHDVKY